MKRSFALVLGLAMVAAVTAPAHAGNNVYRCEMKGQDRGWLPKELIIAHSDGSGGATVIDPIIQHFVGKPLGAKVKKDNAKIVSFQWTLRAQDSRGQNIRWQYRASITKASGKLSLVATPLGYVGPLNGGGSCKKS